MHRPAVAVLAAFVLAGPALAQRSAAPDAAANRLVHIHLPESAPSSVSGRLLLFVTAAPNGKPPAELDADEFHPQSVTVAAQEIPNLSPGQTLTIDADITAFPAGLSALKPGAYIAQAVLDTHRDYAYSGRGPGDISSPVISFSIGGKAPPLTLDLTATVPPRDPWQQPARVPAPIRALVAAMRPNVSEIHFQSPALTGFWGRLVIMRGWVLTPPGYSTAPGPYPTAYYIHGFGGSYASSLRPLSYINAAMVKGEMPPMIWVALDQSSPTGTHEFADSVNNGPWGTALTRELIPYLETQYRMDARPSGRFLTGHSSGGWATLWLQTAYPALFGGTWSTSPDPSDFHDFTGVDLYAPHANLYRRADGTQYPLMRMHGKPVATIQDIAQLEAVLGPAGGQMSAFDWVFSPRGPDGAPIPLFNRATGAVDPDVVAYWHDHYDIANVVTAHWKALAPDLTGKIHVIVGDADTFYLDGAAHRLQTALDQLHAGAQITFVPGRGHFDLYRKGNDEFGLMKDIGKVMYAAARPEAAAQAPAAAKAKAAQ